MKLDPTKSLQSTYYTLNSTLHFLPIVKCLFSFLLLVFYKTTPVSHHCTPLIQTVLLSKVILLVPWVEMFSLWFHPPWIRGPSQIWGSELK